MGCPWVIRLRLSLARLGAGQDQNRPEPQVVHALVALEVGAAQEAAWAMTRCAQVVPSWERPSLHTRLDTFAGEHPDLDTTALHAALDRVDEEPPDAAGDEGDD